MNYLLSIPIGLLGMLYEAFVARCWLQWFIVPAHPALNFSLIEMLALNATLSVIVRSINYTDLDALDKVLLVKTFLKFLIVSPTMALIAGYVLHLIVR